MPEIQAGYKGRILRPDFRAKGPLDTSLGWSTAGVQAQVKANKTAKG